MSGDLIGTSVAAGILGLSTATVNRLAASGVIPTAYKTAGRNGAHIFNRADVEAYKAKRERLAAS